MAIINEKNSVRVCDLCGKREGVHIKSEGFYDTAPSLIIKNYDGVPLIFKLDIVVNAESTNVNNILGDVMQSYEKIQQPPTIQLIPYSVMEKQIKGDKVVCKKCYTSLVNMISKYGKFNKVEEF